MADVTLQQFAVYFIGDNGLKMTIYLNDYNETRRRFESIDLSSANPSVPVAFVADDGTTVTLTFKVGDNPTLGEIDYVFTGNEFSVLGNYSIQANPTWPPSANQPLGKSIHTMPDFTQPKYLYVRKPTTPVSAYKCA